MSASSSHPLDEAVALTPLAPGRYRGHTHPAYGNMVGPYGGITAATLVQAVLQHPDCLGTPVALTVNFAAPVAEGAFVVEAVPVCTNRSSQHWTIQLTQSDAEGHPQVCTTGTLMTALRRGSWARNDLPMPSAAPVDAVPRWDTTQGRVTVAWLQRYAMHPLQGALPQAPDAHEQPDSITSLWVRDEPARPLDFVALTGLSDVFYPRIWLRRGEWVPAGTVSMTVYFHADAAALAAAGSGYLLARAQANAFGGSFFDQTAHLWSEATGALLVSTHQMVYYKA